MSKKLHQNLIYSDGIHVINHWSVLDNTARDALVVTATDVGKVAHVTSTGSFFLLTASGPAVWSNMVTGAVSGIVSLLTAGENLAAGDYISVQDDGVGGFEVVKANAALAIEAHGFVLAATLSGNQAAVYFSGHNTSVVGQVPGRVYLSAVTPGLGTPTPPVGVGEIIQVVGVATSATSVVFTNPHFTVIA